MRSIADQHSHHPHQTFVSPDTGKELKINTTINESPIYSRELGQEALKHGRRQQGGVFLPPWIFINSTDVVDKG